MLERDPGQPGGDAAEPFHVTELAERLAGPDGLSVKGACLAQMDCLLPRMEELLRSGVSRDEYKNLQIVRDAFAAAHGFLARYPVKGRSAQISN